MHSRLRREADYLAPLGTLERGGGEGAAQAMTCVLEAILPRLDVNVRTTVNVCVCTFWCPGSLVKNLLYPVDGGGDGGAGGEVRHAGVDYWC